jgi:diguanylate cyclase
MSTKTLLALQNWSSVGRWTLFGTLACIMASVTFNAAFFGGMEPSAVTRSLVSATVLPLLLGAPLFFYLSLRMRALAISNIRLGLVARTDSLTACLNRGAFTARVNASLETQQHGALLIIDADNFKQINDVHGHVAGDEALTVIARAIRSVVRAGDLVGRMGGEEFGVYLPGADAKVTQAIAERIRRSMSLAVFAPAGTPQMLSVSIGGAVFEAGATFQELFRLADQRLYAAKRGGRNQAVIADLNDQQSVSWRSRG